VFQDALPGYECPVERRYLPANIKRIREERGLTQEQLAEAAGLSVATVQVLESARANPTAEVLLAVAKALRSKLDPLFKRCEMPKVKPGRPRR
jgi:transcriptional regulator with XRE-family HTH domain